MTEEAGGKGKKKIWLWIPLTLILIASAGVSAWFLLIKKESEQDAEVIDQPEFEDLKENEVPLSIVYPLNPFTINLKDGKYLRFSIAIKFSKEKIPDVFFSKEYEIRDKLISYFNGKSSDEILSPELRYDLKKEIISLIKTTIEDDIVTDIYFTDLVAQ
ncbi:MAG: flagellar basal body-associated FliL family protein [Deltaproteobacteria bacterium]|nr:flagellar basal body-associated FliL family protein [Deltaproteobacteria bacterium]MCX7953419.1 flagellar basal body-associated FliL family protein [Deltaproteobacteria bacterium]